MIGLIEKSDYKTLFKLLFDDITPIKEFIDIIDSEHLIYKKDIVRYIEKIVKEKFNKIDLKALLENNYGDNGEIKNNENIKNHENLMLIKLLTVIELGRRFFYISDNVLEYIYTPEQLYKKYVSLFLENKEIVYCFYFDIKQKLLGRSIISMGTSDFAFIRIKDIILEAIKFEANGIIVVHNHPTGDLRPSYEDIRFTKKLKKICKDLGFSLLDHIIFSKESYYSMRENGDFY